MFRILHDTRYDFIKPWRIMAGATALWILLGLIMYFVHGFNYSTDFTGGTQMNVRFARAVSASDVRSAVDRAGFRGSEIQQYGSDREYTVKAPLSAGGTTGGSEATVRSIMGGLQRAFGNDVKLERSDFVGPKVGEELRRNATVAMLISFLVVLVYLAFRFEWRFGLAAVLASAHDIFTTFAFIAIFKVEISLTVVAAILTVIGYSLNDTIIIFDRVRENLKKQRRESLYDVMNRSINETLPRSILTHATTAASTLALLFFAGEVIRPFALVMTFGIVTGTFSSIYAASVLLLYIERKWPRVVGETKGTARALAAERRQEPRVPQRATTR